MSQNSNTDLEIFQNLKNIAITTEKIKQEFELINELVKDNGSLNTSINNCNATIRTMLGKQGVKVDELLDSDQNNEELMRTVPLTVDAITQKLMSFMDK